MGNNPFSNFFTVVEKEMEGKRWRRRDGILLLKKKQKTKKRNEEEKWRNRRGGGESVRAIAVYMEEKEKRKEKFPTKFTS